MASHAFRLLNVFTRNGESFTGNPLCVFEDGTAFDTTRMQALARQFNLSETTFILPSGRASARVRIFTPEYEMPFAGHPTLGTAAVCRALGLAGDSLTLEMQAGVIPVSAAGSRWTLQANAPRWREVTEPASELAAAIGVPAAALGGRPLWVNAGREQLIVPLASIDAVRQAQPRVEGLQRLVSEDGGSMALLFAPYPGTDSSPLRLYARFFFPQGPAILEDPATGSAASNLGGWFIATRAARSLQVEIDQGEQTGRPSRLHLQIDASQRILVSGEVVELGRGALSL